MLNQSQWTECGQKQQLNSYGPTELDLREKKFVTFEIPAYAGNLSGLIYRRRRKTAM